MGDRSPRQVLAEFDALLGTVATTESLPAGLASAARSQVAAIRREVALGQMTQLPISRLRETAKGLRLDALERAGYRTVAQLLAASAARLRAAPGVGDATATQALGAARQVLAATEQVVRLHFDVMTRPAAQTEVLLSLRRYDLAIQALDEWQEVID